MRSAAPHLRRTSPAIRSAGARLLLSIAFLAAAIEARADSENAILGVWTTQKNHGHVLIENCSGAVCAKVLDGDQLRNNPAQTDVYNPDPGKRGRLVKGLTILQGYRGGPTHWEGGAVYDPQTGDESSDSSLDLLDKDTLKIEGCKFLLCRSEIWTRAKDMTRQATSNERS